MIKDDHQRTKHASPAESKDSFPTDAQARAELSLACLLLHILLRLNQHPLCNAHKIEINKASTTTTKITTFIKMKYSIMSIFAVITSVHAGSVADYVQGCPGESQDFDVSLEFSGGTSYHAACPHSYARCPFGDWSDPSKCLGNPTDWTSEGGRSFDYLETHQFRQKNGKPKYIRVDDKKGEYSCARAFYQDKFIDFPLGKERGLDIKEWWDGREEPTYEPLQMSIIPFNPSNGSGCSGGSIDDFNAERLVAIWISPYGGQETNPNDASSVYCDLSVNPEDCLNLPYWGVESKSWGDELVLHGTLSKVLQEGKDVDIFLPEGYDLNMPINNIQLRFQIAAGSTEACKDYINGGQSTCMINKLYRTAEGTEAKVTVSGLGRINGWNAMKTQREQNFYLNINDPYQFSNAGSGDSSDSGKALNDASLNWEAFAQWFISGQLLSLSSKKTGKLPYSSAVLSNRMSLLLFSPTCVISFSRL